ncbi:MAG: YggT family protein [Actinomycetota bacterium]
MPHTVKIVLEAALNIFLLLLFVRWISELVMSLSRDWRPSGFLIVVFEITYTVTDPPLKALRRVIPPLTCRSSCSSLS